MTKNTIPLTDAQRESLTLKTNARIPPYRTATRGKELRPVLTTVLVLLAIALAVGVWVAQSWFEASAFNRATGKNVSTWDAMWIELRVQDGAK